MIRGGGSMLVKTRTEKTGPKSVLSVGDLSRNMVNDLIARIDYCREASRLNEGMLKSFLGKTCCLMFKNPETCFSAVSFFIAAKRLGFDVVYVDPHSVGIENVAHLNPSLVVYRHHENNGLLRDAAETKRFRRTVMSHNFPVLYAGSDAEERSDTNPVRAIADAYVASQREHIHALFVGNYAASCKIRSFAKLLSLMRGNVLTFTNPEWDTSGMELEHKEIMRTVGSCSVAETFSGIENANIVYFDKYSMYINRNKGDLKKICTNALVFDEKTFNSQKEHAVVVRMALMDYLLDR